MPWRDGLSPLRANPNIVFVGPGGGFSTPQAAIDAVSADAAADNPMVVKLLPGEHDAFTMADYVSVDGSGRRSSIVNCTSASSILLANDVSLSNLKPHYTGTAGGSNTQAAVEVSGAKEEVRIHNLDFLVDGIAGHVGGNDPDEMRCALSTGTSNTELEMWNCRVKTNAGGFRVGGGNVRIHDTNVYLVGDNDDCCHIGLYVKAGCRLDWYGGRICTGYMYDEDVNDDDYDVVCVWCPSDNVSNPRIHLHDLVMFARNENAQAGVNVNVIRAENGWFRLFGCFGQKELGANTNSNTSKTVYAPYRTANEPASGELGKVELLGGSRITDYEGNVIGMPVRGVQTLTEATSLDKFEGGLLLCDGTSAAFTVTLRSPNSPMPSGEVYHFMKSDSSGNAITIDLNGANYQGSGTDITLSSQYDDLKIQWSGTEWVDA